MNKDYAKKRRGRYAKTSSFEPIFLMPAWAWMILGISLGIGLSALVYWKTHQEKSLSASDVTIVMEDKAGKTKLKTLAKKRDSQSGESRFDFYTLLPNMAQESPETIASAATTSPPPAASAPTLHQALTLGNEPEPFTYTIQAGSFRHLHQAEELKAKLALSGFTASIQTYRLGSKETWHRVTIGPYKNREQAVASQQKLEQTQALHSLLVKNRV